MTRSEFWEWMNTCPTHKWDILEDDVGHCRILFQMNEDEDEEEEAQASLVLVRELAVLEALQAKQNSPQAGYLAAHSPQAINKKNKVRK